MNNEEIKNLPIYAVSPDPEQARKRFVKEDLQELANSIALNGVISPIIVSPLPNNQYQIIAGERRWRASILAKKTTIPAIVRELEPFTRQVQSLIENIQRSDLNPVEEAKGYRRLIDEFALSHEELAERVGKSRASITNSLRLLNLPEFVQQCLIEGSISSGHAKVILGLNNEADMIYVCGKAAGQKLSVKDTAALVDNLKNEKKRTSRDDQDQNSAQTQSALEQRALELNLTRLFGSQVTLDVNKNKKGNIKIAFNDFEELDRILEILGYQH